MDQSIHLFIKKYGEQKQKKIIYYYQKKEIIKLSELSRLVGLPIWVIRYWIKRVIK